MKSAASISLAVTLLAGASSALADTPKVGDSLSLASWPKLQWLYAEPSDKDAAGKVVVHWFCGPKVATCTDDLARMISLRDNGRTYIVAYVDGQQYQAKKLDPIRESEGVGRGTVAYGPQVGKLMKELGVAPGPTSIVVGTDGKVAMISTGGDAASLDARDQKIAALIGAIKDYAASYDGPKSAKPGEQFTFRITVTLASWLAFNANANGTFALSAPGDMKCDSKKLNTDQLKVDGRVVSATVKCSAPRGSYEVQGRISFGYLDPARNAGVVEDGTTWKFVVQ
jgi:hypothetical protein